MAEAAAWPLVLGVFAGAPTSLLLGLFAAGAAALTALYLLKLERRRLVVPYVRLWARVLGEQRTQALWRRLRRWVSLLVQLVLLGLLLVALGEPEPARSAAGRTIALVIDASASMQATDVAPLGLGSRLDRARQAARELAAGLGPDDRATVIRLDGQPLALGGLTADERDLGQRIDGITATDGPADLEAALRLAADVLRGHAHPMVVLIGDGAWPREVLERVRFGPSAPSPAPVPVSAPASASGPAIPGSATPAVTPRLDAIDLAGIDLRYLPVGTSGDNLGIIGFSVRRYRQNRASFEVLIEVQSFATEPTRARLEILQDGEVIDALPLELRPGERVQRVLPDLAGATTGAGAGTRLEARLSPATPGPSGPSGSSKAAGGQGASSPGWRDFLPLDDRAYAVLAPRPKERVLLVTAGNLFLEAALLLNENAAIDKIAPAAYGPAEAARYDVVIFDGVTPPEPPATAALYLDPQGPASPFRVVRDEPAVLVTEVAERHPVMRWVTLRDLNVKRSSVFALAPGDVALVSSLRAPILVARERAAGGARRLALGFDVRHSDLPLRVAFPVLLVNALDWLGEAPAGEDEAPLRSGRVWRLPAPRPGADGTPTGPRGAGDLADTARTLRVRDPEGHLHRVPVVEGFGHFQAGRAGFYEVDAPGAPPPHPPRGGADGQDRRRLLAANLADAAESTIRPAPAGGLVIGGQRLAPPEGFVRRPARAWWMILLALALVLSFVEWVGYHRRVTV